MHGYRRAALIGAVLALVAGGMALVLRSGSVPVASSTSGSSAGGPMAVVLAPTPASTRVIVVDLRRHAVVRSIALRSLVTDMEVDRVSGLVVAAQTGGIGERADDAVSIIDPRSGRVRYVTLPLRDPVNVVCLDGRAYVLHAIVDAEGLVVSIVDVARGTVVGRGHVPDGPGVWGAAGGALWSARSRASGGWDTVRLDVASLRVTGDVGAGGVLASGLVDIGGRLAVLGARDAVDGAPAPALAIIDTRTMSVLASASVEPLTYPARIAVPVGEQIVVGDWAGQDPEPSTLVALDRSTLDVRSRIAIPGAPCALGAWSGRLLVVERTSGRLLRVDARTGEVEAATDLGTGELLVSDIAVLE